MVSSDLISQKVTIGKEESLDEEAIEIVKDAKQQEPLLLEIQSFLDAMKQKDKKKEHDGIAKPQEALNVTKIAEAALLSSQKGSPIYQSLK